MRSIWGWASLSIKLDSIHEQAEGRKQRRKIKCVHEGCYAAEVEVGLLKDDTGWLPYLSVEDANTLDHVRRAIRQGDLELAAKHGRIYGLCPVGHQ